MIFSFHIRLLGINIKMSLLLLLCQTILSFNGGKKHSIFLNNFFGQ